MAFNLDTVPDLADPLLGFRFGVFFLGGLGLAHPLDFRFQEVSGLEARAEPIAVQTLGTEGSTQQLPGKTQFKNLVLKRGMPKFSSLRQELQLSLLSASSTARQVLVSILDDQGLPLNSWLFTEAYPVRWSLDGLNASSSQVIVETMELTYSNLRPFSL